MSFRNRRSIRDFSYKFLLRNEYCYNQNVLWELKNFISNCICIRHYRKNDATSTLSINEFMNFNELYQINQFNECWQRRLHTFYQNSQEYNESAGSRAVVGLVGLVLSYHRAFEGCAFHFVEIWSVFCLYLHGGFEIFN